jgi:multiple sugar transport system substrate-binding protein
MDGPIVLRALGWDHPRCRAPMEACAAAYPPARVVWEYRSLESFGDQPLAELADDYDLVVIDHPHIGEAVDAGCLRSLDVPDPGSVGASHTSYAYAGRHWALAVDAACQVAAWHPSLAEPPGTWEEVLALAGAREGRVALPLHPAHALCSLATLCAQAGAPFEPPLDLAAIEAALARLAAVAALAPAEAFDWEPPAALEWLARGDGDYVPLAFGFVSYAGDVGFGPPPGGPGGAILGGAGLAVTAASDNALEAQDFALWCASGPVQIEIVAAAGGQPASRAAWYDDAVDAAAHGFYSGTRAAIEGAWTRPRDAWWPPFQRDGGQLVHDGLRAGRPPGEIAAGLSGLR